MATYTPNPYDSAQPVDSVFAGTAAAEFRAMKVALQALTSGAFYQGDWTTYTAGAGPHPADLGDQFTHSGSLWLLKTTVADVELIPPSDLDTTNWFKLYQQTSDGVVTTTGTTGSARMPAGTTAQRDVAPTVGFTRWNSSLQMNETWDGTYWVPAGWVELATASTSGGATALLSALPTWPNELALRFEGTSISVADDIRIRLGTAGGLVAAGYLGVSQYVNMASATVGATRTTGIFLEAAAAEVLSGDLILRRRGTVWTYQGAAGDHGASGVVNTAGRVDIAAPLTQIEIFALTGVLDAGNVYLMGRK